MNIAKVLEIKFAAYWSPLGFKHTNCCDFAFCSPKCACIGNIELILKNESSKFWLGVLNEIKGRGVKTVNLFCVDGLSGFREAINAVVKGVTNFEQYIRDDAPTFAKLQFQFRYPCVKMILMKNSQFGKNGG